MYFREFEVRTCCSLYFRTEYVPTGFMLKLDSCQLRFFQFAYVIVLIYFLSTVISPPAREQHERSNADWNEVLGRNSEESC